MYISRVDIYNYRLLNKTVVSCEKDLSLIIGKNNCGKTSFLSVLSKCVGNKGEVSNFDFNDFSTSFQKKLYEVVKGKVSFEEEELTGIRVDFYIKYNEKDDLTNISKLMLDLEPENTVVILRYEYVIKNNLEKLKEEVYRANMDLPKYGLVTFTWGNVSGIDRESGLFVIKPSGVEYDKLTPDDMVVVDLNGNKVEGRYNPSSDTPTHVVLYNRFPKIGGVVHTHSTWATSWAQAGRDIPCYGTTHADYIYGEIPCVRNLTKEEIEEAYEKNTGVLIADEFERKAKDYLAVPAVLCKNHGVFTWGKDAHEAVHNAVVAEEVAKMAARCEIINPDVKPAPQELQDKHYYRKHGANAYYGQK